MYDSSKYLNYQELSQLLKSFAKDSPDFMKVESIGKSPEDRDLWLCTITDIATGDASTKPAYWVSGNIHASELSGCQSAVHTIFRILEGIKNNETRFIELLKNNTLYVVPRISPDGVEAVLKGGYYRSSNQVYPHKNTAGFFAQDIDGDNIVRKLLKKDPGGIWKKSKKDPRILIQRKANENNS